MEKEIIKPTYAIAIRIWLAIFWRQLFIIASLVIIGFMFYWMLNFLNATLGAKFLNVFTISTILLIPILMSFYVMKQVLKRKFKNFSLMTVQRSPNNGDVLEQQVQPTYAIAFKFWWATWWRPLLLFTVLGSLIGLLLGLYCGFMKVPFPVITKGPFPEITMNVLGYLVGSLVSMYVIKTQLNKKFKTFSIFVVKNEGDNAEEIEAEK